MIVHEMFVCSSFLISVCMFIVSKALLISSATVIVRAGGAIWLNPFVTVLFSVCSAVTVECCVCVMLYPCMLCVSLLVCMFVLYAACLTVFVNCFAMCLGVVAILLLNGLDVFSVYGGALLDRPCMVFQRVCVLCL